jgi:hypothetical protein
MWRRLAATALLVLVAVATSTTMDSPAVGAQALPTSTPTPMPWPIFQHDSRHTGRSQFPGPARVGRLWSYDTGTGSLTGSPIVGLDGTVYVGGGGYLHAISRGGTALWRLPVGSSFGTVLQAADGMLYVTGATGTSNTVYQLWPDGTVLSRFTATGSFMSPLALALAADGTVYFGVGNSQGTGGVLYALTPNPVAGTMAQRWRLNTGFLAGSQPAVDPFSGFVYFGSYEVGGTLYAVAPSGAVLWRSESLGYINSSPSLDTDGTVYVAGNRPRRDSLRRGRRRAAGGRPAGEPALAAELPARRARQLVGRDLVRRPGLLPGDRAGWRAERGALRDRRDGGDALGPLHAAQR